MKHPVKIATLLAALLTLTVGSTQLSIRATSELCPINSCHGPCTIGIFPVAVCSSDGQTYNVHPVYGCAYTHCYIGPI